MIPSNLKKRFYQAVAQIADKLELDWLLPQAAPQPKITPTPAEAYHMHLFLMNDANDYLRSSSAKNDLSDLLQSRFEEWIRWTDEAKAKNPIPYSDGTNILHLAAGSSVDQDLKHNVLRRARLINYIVSIDEHGNLAPINGQDEDGNTPLHLAEKIGIDYIADTLRHWGASNDIKNKAGQTPRDIQAQRGQTEEPRFIVG